MKKDLEIFKNLALSDKHENLEGHKGLTNDN
jgi:hypothetical protein